MSGNIKHTTEFINDYLKQYDCYLTAPYINIDVPIEFICNKHPEFVQTAYFNNFRNGQKCAHCANEVKAALHKEKIKETLLSFDAELISVDHDVFGHYVVFFKCLKHPDKGIHKCGYGVFTGSNARSGCKFCIKDVLNAKKLIKVREAFEKDGWELLSTEYVNRRVPLKYRHLKYPDGIIKTITWKAFQEKLKARDNT